MSLFSAFISKSLEIKSFAAGDSYSLTSLGMLKSALHILSYNSSSVAPLYGNYPESIVNKRTPRAQMSAGGPQYSVFRTISGAMYDGVPQKILIFLSFGTQVENPKSIILISLSSSSNRFSSFMSL